MRRIVRSSQTKTYMAIYGIRVLGHECSCLKYILFVRNFGLQGVFFPRGGICKLNCCAGQVYHSVAWSPWNVLLQRAAKRQRLLLLQLVEWLHVLSHSCFLSQAAQRHHNKLRSQVVCLLDSIPPMWVTRSFETLSQKPAVHRTFLELCLLRRWLI